MREAHSCLPARTEGRHVLIDGRQDSAAVRAAIDAVGVDEDDLDLVLITHDDADHIGGLVDEEYCPIYTNAGFVLRRDLW
jgi:glyoxylase-like metal-dependent hydrolase (beta-lactamase superfamily II)